MGCPKKKKKKFKGRWEFFERKGVQSEKGAQEEKEEGKERDAQARGIVKNVSEKGNDAPKETEKTLGEKKGRSRG